MTRRLDSNALGLAAAVAADVVVAAGAFTLSFAGLRSYAVGQMRISPDLAWILPIVVDGLTVVAIVSTVLLRDQSLPVRAYAWGLLLFAVACSVGGNAAHVAGETGTVGLVGAGLVPLLLALANHLVVVLVRHGKRQAPARVQLSTASSKAVPAATKTTTQRQKTERPGKTGSMPPDSVEAQRARARAAVQAGTPKAQIARDLGVPRNRLYRLLADDDKEAA